MLVSFMALATGLPTRKDVGVTGALNLMCVSEGRVGRLCG